MRRADVFALAALLLIGIAFLPPALFTDQVYMPAHSRQFLPWRDGRSVEELNELRERANLTMTDKLFMFHPQILVNRAAFAQGELPLWNPYVLGGVPHLQQQVPAVASPIVALTLLMDPLEAWGWIAAIQLSLAGLLTFLYLRVIGHPTFPALLGALVFALSGWMTSRLHYYQITGACLWLPLALLGVEGLVRGRRLGGVLAISAAIGLAFVSGFPQVAVLTAYLTAAYAVVRGVMLWRARGQRAVGAVVGLAAIACIWGLLLAALQLWPAAEFAFSGESSRADMTVEQFESQRLRPVALATWLAPEAFGSPDWYRTLRSPKIGSQSLLQFTHLSPWENFVEITGYIGILPLLLAVIGAIALFGRQVSGADRFWGGATLLAFLALIGTPLLGLLSRLPGMRFGDPKRLLFVTTFGLAVLAAHGLHRLLSERMEGTMRWRLLASLLALVVALAGLSLWTEDDASLRHQLFAWLADSQFARDNVGHVTAAQVPELLASPEIQVPPEDIDANVALLRAAGQHVAVWSLLAAGAIGLLLARANRGMVALSVIVLLAVVSIDLLRFGAPLNRSMPRDGMYESSPLVELLRQDAGPEGARFFRFGGRQSPPHVPLMPEMGLPHGLNDGQGYITLTVKRYEQFIDLIEPGRSYTAGVRGFEDPRSLASPLLDLLGVRYILTTEPDLPEIEARPRFRDGTTRVYENPGALPRAFLVSGAQVLGSGDEVATALVQSYFDPSRTALVEGELQSTLPSDAEPVADGARILDYGLRTVVVEVSPTQPGLLVLTENWMPGWKATVDGEARPVLRTDYTFRGVEVGIGDRYVHFRYSPPSARNGLLVTLASAGAWLLLALVAGVGLFRSRSRNGLQR